MEEARSERVAEERRVAGVDAPWAAVVHEAVSDAEACVANPLVHVEVVRSLRPDAEANMVEQSQSDLCSQQRVRQVCSAKGTHAMGC